MLCANTVQILLLNLVEAQYPWFVNNFERSSCSVLFLNGRNVVSLRKMLMNITYVGLQTYFQTF